MGDDRILVTVHTGDVVRLFKKTGDKISDAHVQSAEKGKKAAKAVKQMNELIEQAG